MQKYLEGGRKRAFVVGTSFLCMATGILAIALVVSQVTHFSGIRAYGPAETWKWVIGAAGLIVWSGLVACSIRFMIFQKRMVLYCSAPLLFMFSAHLMMPDQVVKRKAPGRLLMRQAERVRPDIILVSDGDTVCAVCWFYKRNDVLLLGRGGELSYGLDCEFRRHRRLDGDQLRELLTKTQGVKGVVLIAEAESYAQYRSMLPKPVFYDTDGRFVFAQF